MNSMAVLAVAWKLNKMVISNIFQCVNAALRGLWVAGVWVNVEGRRASEYIMLFRILPLNPARGIIIACWELNSSSNATEKKKISLAWQGLYWPHRASQIISCGAPPQRHASDRRFPAFVLAFIALNEAISAGCCTRLKILKLQQIIKSLQCQKIKEKCCPEPNVMLLNGLFCPTNSPKPKYIHYTTK